MVNFVCFWEFSLFVQNSEDLERDYHQLKVDC